MLFLSLRLILKSLEKKLKFNIDSHISWYINIIALVLNKTKANILTRLTKGEHI
jgi:hypothetical protein